jgi:hypothetical protein
MRLFGKRKKLDGAVEGGGMANEPDQASGYEPVPRYPGAAMISHSVDENNRIYIEYETIDPLRKVGNWYINQKDYMKNSGWKLESWTPPYAIQNGLSGKEPFMSLVYYKVRGSCSIGVKWYPQQRKIWVDYRE